MKSNPGIMVGPKEWDAHEQDDLMERFNVMVVVRPDRTLNGL